MNIYFPTVKKKYCVHKLKYGDFGASSYPPFPPHAVYFTPLHAAMYPWRNLILGALIFGLLADTLCVGLVTGLISLISASRIQIHLENLVYPPSLILPPLSFLFVRFYRRQVELLSTAIFLVF